MKIFKHLRSDWFRYGFETIAVVIGILVAFALDNWNEKRKDAVIEKYYLQRLCDDLFADITEIDTTVKYASEYIVIGNNILEILGQDYISDIQKSTDFTTTSFIENALNHYDIEVSTENFGRFLGYLFDERIVDMNNFTYRELISTGNFEVIKNPALRKNLTNYYLNFSAVLDIQDNLLASVDEFNKTLKVNNIPIINSLTFNDLHNQLISDDGNELQTSIRNLIWNHAYSISPFQNEFRPLCLELIHEINEYLEQL